MTHFSRLGSQSAATRFAGAALLQVRITALLALTEASDAPSNAPAIPCMRSQFRVDPEHRNQLAIHDVQLRELPTPDGGDDARRTREGDLQDNVFRYALAAESYEVRPPGTRSHPL